MIHKEFDGRQVRIPRSLKIGDVKYAGWEDWYLVYVEGMYYVRERANVIEEYLLPVTNEREAS